jgi:hypothetical protein
MCYIHHTTDRDESVARGCALMCAIMSPSFRVKDFAVKDLTPLAVDLHWGPAPASLDAADGSRDGDLTDETHLFIHNNVIPSTKVCTVRLFVCVLHCDTHTCKHNTCTSSHAGFKTLFSDALGGDFQRP